MLESEYPECYPSLDSTDDLSNLYTIDRVIIKRIGHEDHAYCIFVCSSCLDYEHGITITLHKDRIIDHGEDWDDKKVCEHKGIDYTTYHEKIVKDYNHKELILTEPNPKYGKLKPWQKSQNDYYPYGLFHAKKNAELTNFIDSKKANKGVVPSLLKLSIANNRKELINYFLEKSSHFLYPAFMEALRIKDYELMEKILDKGFNLNERVAQSSPFNYVIGELSNQIENLEDRQKEIKLMKYLLNKGLDPYLEDKFKRNSYCRIDRISSWEKRNKVLSVLKENGLMSKD